MGNDSLPFVTVKVEMPETYDLLIIGGGLPGLLGAVLAKLQHPHWSVALVEKENVLGGNLVGEDALGDHFELGTHLLQETGNAEIDRLLRESVDPKHLLALDSQVGDRVGTIQGGRAFENTGYPAVMEQDQTLSKVILDEIIQIIGRNESPLTSISELRSTPLKEAAIQWFGESAWSSVVQPIISTKFGLTDSLTGFVLELANLSRLQVASEEIWQSNSHVDGFRARVAFPRQTRLPAKFRHDRKTLYSREHGNKDFVLGLIERCTTLGVALMPSCDILNLDPYATSMTVSRDGKVTELRFKRAISSLGVSATGRLIGGSAAVQQRRISLHLVHVKLNKPMPSSVCYFYDHDHESSIFRVTNYAAFSDRFGDKRLTVELFNMADHDRSSIIEYVKNSSALSSLLPQSFEVVSASCSRTLSLAVPTTQNVDELLAQERLLSSQSAGVLAICGVGTNGFRFFQSETIKDITALITEMI